MNTTSNNYESTKWGNGRVSGTCFKRNGGNKWTVRVKGYPDKLFENLEDAKEYQTKCSNAGKLTKNQYKIISQNGEKKYLIVQLSQDYVMLTDYKYKEIIDTYPLCVTCSGSSKDPDYYVLLVVDGKNMLFHKYITGNEMTDHINREPLDNRTENLRPTNHLLNNRNRISKKNSELNQDIGIRKVDNDTSFQARIKASGKEISRQFSIIKYGEDKAKKKAIEWRKKMSTAVENSNGLILPDDAKQNLITFKDIMKKYAENFKWKQKDDIFYELNQAFDQEAYEEIEDYDESNFGKLTKEVLELLKEKNMKLISKNLKIEKKLEEIEVCCPNRHEFKTNYSFIKKRNCPLCFPYYNEEICRNIFEKMFEESFYRQKPKWLEGLELDGYNKDLNLAFEYQGIQHYQFIKYLQENEEEFQKRLKNDKRKLELCNKNNVNLVIIPYNTENLKEFIEHKCLSFGYKDINTDFEISIESVDDIKKIKYFDNQNKEINVNETPKFEEPSSEFEEDGDFEILSKEEKLKRIKDSFIKLYSDYDIDKIDLVLNKIEHIKHNCKEYKYCSKCNEWKDISEFYKHKQSYDCLARICKICKNISSKPSAKNWKQENKEKVKEYNKMYREKMKDKKLENKKEEIKDEDKKNEDIESEDPKRNEKISQKMKEFLATEEGKKSKEESHKKRSETMAKQREEIQQNLTSKICKKCNTDKEISEFSKKSDTKDGYQPYCRDCVNAAKRAARK
jgi:hypothetical protein